MVLLLGHLRFWAAFEYNCFLYMIQAFFPFVIVVGFANFE